MRGSSSTSNAQTPKWNSKTGEAALLARDDFQSGKFSMDDKVGGVEMWSSRPEYMVYDKSKFATNIKRIRDEMRTEQGRKSK
jgi:hypothetical protein